MNTRISVIIVNYKTAEFVLRCVDSILAGDSDGIEVIVVDNSTDRSEAKRLEVLIDRGVRVIINTDNCGFARGCNQGVMAATGQYIMFLNPDTLVFDGCLQRLVDCLEGARDVGAVGPRTWWDSARTMQLIQQRLPSPSLSIIEALSGLRYFNLAIDRALLQRDYLHATTTTPLSVAMLPGAAILTYRAILQRVGPFDEGYPLYFEDSDWCRRLKQHKLNLYMAPDAEICHFYNQSARTDSGGSFGKFAVSQQRYMARHHGKLSPLAATAMAKAIRKLSRRHSPTDITDIGVIRHQPRFSSDRHFTGRLLFQLSVNTAFVPSAIAFVDRADFQLPQEVWSYLGHGVYYARFVTPQPYSVLDTWQFTK
ncbi:MAG: glycosyltransferase family 2 protein [Nitrospirae bacterium]|uniref:glycosyltransferase family 2 protein n=1 Tax=Candidatus Magnetobacterium casense TaxID=1455061 RepID=UPI00058F7587|nr:glycosyltransferase family 2 protein [Candidatus Magnetobacterium casensis]MBF0337703.1 glycosyltransferase family 2 protein [Nitrospirota bacterium]